MNPNISKILTKKQKAKVMFLHQKFKDFLTKKMKRKRKVEHKLMTTVSSIEQKANITTLQFIHKRTQILSKKRFITRN